MTPDDVEEVAALLRRLGTHLSQAGQRAVLHPEEFKPGSEKIKL